VATYRITAPLANFTGEGPGGLSFVDGSATSDSPAIVGYCQGAGYTVEPVDGVQASDTKPTGRSRTRKAPKGDA
jgi:hypothetical protein